MSQHHESAQTEGFVAESVRFVTTHLDDYPAAPAWLLHSPRLREHGVTSVLDVGCGPATFLASVVEGFGIERAVGVEPSAEAVAALTAKHARDPRIRFVSASAHALPFGTDEFDLVICWSVLHWLGRNEYLQAIGELVRVTRRHLVIMDFVADEDYRVAYSHDRRYFTYKADFAPAVLSSGVMGLRDDARWWDGNQAGAVVPLTAASLRPFLGNPLSYHARRACVFEKDYDLLPTHAAEDFGA